MPVYFGFKHFETHFGLGASQTYFRITVNHYESSWHIKMVKKMIGNE